MKLLFAFVAFGFVFGAAAAHAAPMVEVTHDSSGLAKGYYTDLPKGSRIMLVDFYGEVIEKVKPVKAKASGKGTFSMKVPSKFKDNAPWYRFRAVGPESLPIIYDESSIFSFSRHPDKKAPDCTLNASKHTVAQGEPFTLTWSSKNAKTVQGGVIPSLDGHMLATKGRYTHSEQKTGMQQYGFAFNGVVYGTDARYTQSRCTVHVLVK